MQIGDTRFKYHAAINPATNTPKASSSKSASKSGQKRIGESAASSSSKKAKALLAPDSKLPIDCIVQHRHSNSGLEYNLCYEGYSSTDGLWEPATKFKKRTDFAQVLAQFHRKSLLRMRSADLMAGTQGIPQQCDRGGWCKSA